MPGHVAAHLGRRLALRGGGGARAGRCLVGGQVARRLARQPLLQARREVAQQPVRDVLHHPAAAERGEPAGDREVGDRVDARPAAVGRVQRVDDRRARAALAALVAPARRERRRVRLGVGALDLDRAAVGRGRRTELDLELAVVGAVLVVPGDRRPRQARRDLLEVDQRRPHLIGGRVHLERVLQLHRRTTSRSARVSMSCGSARSPHSTSVMATPRKPVSPRSSPARARTASRTTTGWPGRPS